MSTKRRKSIGNQIINFVILIILLICVYFAYDFYQSNNFNNFIKSESNLHTSEFKRDNEIKYSKKSSYRITSNEYNDAMFYENIKLTKNTPYKITCMVKTDNVEAKDNKTGSGAQISIENTTERSVAITGTNNWQKIELIFNSKNREEVNIGFRLGGYAADAKGTAWFSDFTIEEGVADNSNTWKFACFIFEKTEVNINDKQINLKVTNSDIQDITTTIDRFEDACEDLSNGKMEAQCDVYRVQTPITSLSYDDEFAYYVAPEDIEDQIKETINNSEYDHIFAIVRLGDDEHDKDIKINDWIGLGAMDYYGIGFSNIRLPNDSKSYIYKYNTRINTFPEEVLLHEFLHSLERTAEEYGYKIPALHDYEKYGYKEETLIGQKKWYIDYMNKTIKADSGLIGLPEEVYKLKPAKNTDFEYSYKVKQYFKQPENIIEEIKELFSNLGKRIEFIFN